MATVIARTVASIPQRNASETWEKIISLLAPDPNGAARAELHKVAGVAASSIASEASKDDAFIVSGSGPQVRIYCAYGEDAVSGDNLDESAFKESPTKDGWQMSIPCLPEDVEWSQRKLKSDSKLVTARATGEKYAANESDASQSRAGLSLNMNEFLKS